MYWHPWFVWMLQVFNVTHGFFQCISGVKVGKEGGKLEELFHLWCLAYPTLLPSTGKEDNLIFFHGFPVNANSSLPFPPGEVKCMLLLQSTCYSTSPRTRLTCYFWEGGSASKCRCWGHQTGTSFMLEAQVPRDQ